MTPAEQLRAAAAKIREAAAKATPGPWATREVPDEVYVEIMAGTEVAVAHAVCEHPAAPGALAADAEWIALMSPAVAEPLAACLELAAELGERQAELVKHHVDGGPCRDTACRTVHAALAVARAILGEAP